MKIALTGATGFIGRYILRQLRSEGHELRAWCRPTSDRSAIEEEQVSWIPGDLTDARSMHSLTKDCDAVVHSALYHPGGGFSRTETSLTHFLDVNLLGSLKLIQTAREVGVPRFVFISTCAVHDIILEDRPLDESHPLWPKSHYGAHKAAIEKFVHSFGFGEGYDICAIRPTEVYGIAHPVNESKWYNLVQGLLRGETVTCKRGGKEVHAMDVARAISILLKAQDIKGQAYNCYDMYVSDMMVAELVQKITGIKGKVLGENTSPKNQIETSKLRSLGMTFGGMDLLRKTVEEMVEVARS